MDAWITPDSIDLPTRRVVLDIPRGEHFFADLTGAVLLLASSENWEQFGLIDPEEVADAWFVALNTLRWDSVSVGDLKYSIDNTESDHWKLCNGQALASADFPELSSICGVRFGIAPPGFFKVPLLDERFLVGASALLPVDSVGGAASVALNANNNGPHDHVYSSPVAAVGDLGPGVPTPNVAAVLPTSTASSGLGTPHENRPPFQAVFALIRALP